MRNKLRGRLPLLLILVIDAIIIAAEILSIVVRIGSLGKESTLSQETVEEGEIYYVQGHLTRMESPLNEKMIAHASNRFSYIYETYLKPENIRPYLAVIPDKNAYLTEDEQERAMDYGALVFEVTSANPFMEYIDITGLLSLDDFYITDSHWRQEKILNVADALAEAMGAELSDVFEEKTLEIPFYGAYYEEGEERVGADTIVYLDSELLQAAAVSLVGEEGEAYVYDLEKGNGDSPYNLFLSGTAAILTIENPQCTNGKKLILFRDSFAGSLAPLLVSGYGQVTLVDIRYVLSSALGEYVDFSGADVLFLYSTLLLNNSMGMK